MLKLNLLVKSGIFIFLIFSINNLSAQEIKVTEFRIANTDISARENVVFDANGDACALLKIRTGLKNLQFSSDLEIRKIESHEGEYWLWVSSNTSKINFEEEGFGRLEYLLPKYSEAYSVYVIFLTVSLPDKIIYKNIKSVRVTTKPERAEIYSNKVFLGYSPIEISITSDTFQFEIRKKKYTSVTDSCVFNKVKPELNVPLKKNPNENWMFINLYASGVNNYGPPFFGFETGMIGKTGWYISIALPLVKKSIATVNMNYENPLIANTKNFLTVIGKPSEGYYIRLKDNNNTFYKHFRLKVGITQKVFKNAYCKAGIGLAVATQWFRLDVIPYSNNPQLEIPLNKTYYGKTDLSITTIVFETGFAYRVLKKCLINFNISTTGFSSWEENEHGNYFFPIEGSIGIGYNFI